MNTEVIEEAEVVKAPKFEPGKQYVWNYQDKLTIMGGELNALHNTLHIVFNENIPDSKAWVMLNALYKVTSDIIKRGVEEGAIKEAPEPEST